MKLSNKLSAKLDMQDSSEVEREFQLPKNCPPETILAQIFSPKFEPLPTSTSDSTQVNQNVNSVYRIIGLVSVALSSRDPERTT